MWLQINVSQQYNVNKQIPSMFRNASCYMVVACSSCLYITTWDRMNGFIGDKDHGYGVQVLHVNYQVST